MHGHVKRKERGLLTFKWQISQYNYCHLSRENLCVKQVSTAGLLTASRIRISPRNWISVNRMGWGGYVYQLDVCPRVDLLPVLYWLCFLILPCSTKYDGWTATVNFRALSTVIHLPSLQLANVVDGVQVVGLLLTDVICVCALARIWPYPRGGHCLWYILHVSKSPRVPRDGKSRLREMGMNLPAVDRHASHFTDEVFQAGFCFTYLAFHLACISHPASAGRGVWLWVCINATCSF